MTSLLKRIYRQVRFRRLHRRDVKLEYDFLGTDYGGWPIVRNLLPANPLVYSFGVGEDISFDLAMIDRYNAEVHGFDPTPRSRRWVSQQTLPQQFHFHPVGIGPKDAQLPFFEPADDKHVSFSNAPGEGQVGEPVMCDVRRLVTIASDNKHEHIDVLKFDIEGFEYEVLDDLVASDVRPSLLLCEFHHGMYKSTDEDTKRAVSALQCAGYRIFYVSATGHEYGFVRTTDSDRLV